MTAGARKSADVPPPAQAAKSPRGQRTRAKIREAANRLFLDQGFKNTTVDAIVAAAGISKGTFYLHFARKEDLLLEYGSRRLRHVGEMIPDLIANAGFAESLNRILDATVRGKQWGRELTGLAIVEMGTGAERLPVDAPHKMLLPLVQVAQARGEIRSDIPAPAIAHFVLRSLLGALRDWGLSKDDLSRDQALDYALTLVLDALRRGV